MTFNLVSMPSSTCISSLPVGYLLDIYSVFSKQTIWLWLFYCDLEFTGIICGIIMYGFSVWTQNGELREQKDMVRSIFPFTFGCEEIGFRDWTILCSHEVDGFLLCCCLCKAAKI